MAWLNLPLRRMAVAAALLVLCVVDASLVGARTASDYTAAQQASTLKFLQGFVTANPSLSAVWTGTDFCSWSYVRCRDAVRSLLDFSLDSWPYNKKLVLPELGDDVNGSAVIFTDIEVRSMGGRVTGTLPASWGRLTALETLQLDGNGLTGTLPSAWSGLKSLTTLYLDNNQLSGGLPPQWRFLSALDTVYLQNNTLSGTLPAEWGRMSSVHYLYLNDNALTGTLPPMWSSLQLLSYLYLNNNQLIGSIPSQWGAIKNVSYVFLTGNKLCGCFPKEWEAVYVFHYYVDAAVSASDCATANVCEVQSASGAEDSDAGAVLTANEKQTLAFLRLVGAAVGGTLQSSWSGVWYCSWPNVECDASGLATVDLSGVALSAAVQLPELTDNIDGSLVDVTTFSLYGKSAMVAGTLPSSWGRLAKLDTLFLYGNKLTGTLPSAWGGMTKLETLRLEKNTLTGSLPSGWGSMVNLGFLYLNDNSLSSTLPSAWGGMTKLEKLHLESNTLSGSLPPQWRFLGTLYEVFLSNNRLSGSVPAAWGRMSSLYNLYINDNELSGTLPEEWGSMPTLFNLSLANNQLVGSIPSQWGSMPWLYFVKLSGNKLCGCLPKKWKASYTIHYYVDPAVSASDCATANVCEVQSASGAEDSDAGAVLTANEKQTLAFLRLVGAAVGGALQSSWSGVWYCNWPNVKCDASGLATVDLSGVALSAAVQLPELTDNIDGSLVDVTTFSLYGKSAMVAGTLPSSWGGLKKLISLLLYGNALNGTLPSAWGGMTKLETLRLEKNTLTGSLPSEWGSMAKLDYLYLNDNALSGTLPVSWAWMTSLNFLSLKNNNLSGAVPEEWTGMTELTSVYLEGNHFCGCLPEKWRSYSPSVSADDALKSDRCAVFNRCTSGSESGDSLEGMTDEEVSTLKFLRALQKLDVSLSQQWTGTDYCSWAYVSCTADGSVELDLSPLPLTTAPQSLTAPMAKAVTSGVAASLPELAANVNGSLVRVTTFKLHGKGALMTGTLPSSWGRLTKLETLYLDGNGLTGTLPSAWVGMASLRTLDVSSNRLSGSVPASWGGLWQLRSVDLTGTGLCGCLPAEWAGKAVAADAALTGSDCASANACPAETSTPAPPPSRKTKSGPNLIPLWCVLGALGGVLVGVAVGLGVRFYRRRRREEELRLFQAQQDNEMEPFRKTTETLN